MNLVSNNTAILVFIRSQREEAKLKQLACAPSLHQNIKILNCLNKRVKKISRATNLAVYTISGGHQHGNNFGERLANSIQQIFQKGYENVIAIGNDCLQLETNTINAAALELQTSNIVLGPDTSGGVYLIGINKSSFHKEDFIELDWQSDALLQTFKTYSWSWNLSLCFLQEASDISNSFELTIALNQLPRFSRIRQKLFVLIKETLSWGFIYLLVKSSTTAYTYPPLRAPPNL